MEGKINNSLVNFANLFTGINKNQENEQRSSSFAFELSAEVIAIIIFLFRQMKFWQDIIQFLLKEEEYHLPFYKQETMNSNISKTYEEIFCPPVGATFEIVEKLGIYCCPADRSLKKAIYLMPRIPVNKVKPLLKEKYDITSFEDINGKGCSIALYKIEDCFSVDTAAIDAIEDEALKKKMKEWPGVNGEILKVFVLSEKMAFQKPLFTKEKNNGWSGYFRLSEIWDEIH